MQILLIAATEIEIAPVLSNGLFADTLITGVGVPETMYHLQKRVHQIDYDLIIQAGIAGSFSEKNNLGDCVIVKQDRFADVGIYEKNNFNSVFDMKFTAKDNFPYQNGWLVNNHNIIETIGLKKVKGITINMISDQADMNAVFIKKYQPEVESMEGAALHYVCLQENIPFLQLRSISNFVGERDKSKWKMKEAIHNLNAEVNRLINQFSLTGLKAGKNNLS